MVFGAGDARSRSQQERVCGGSSAANDGHTQAQAKTASATNLTRLHMGSEFFLNYNCNAFNDVSGADKKAGSEEPAESDWKNRRAFPPNALRYQSSDE